MSVYRIKNKRNLKKGLCTALHPEMLFQTKKKLNILKEAGQRKMDCQMSYFWPLFGSYLCQTSGYRAENFITASSLQPHHMLQVSAHSNVPGLRSIFEGGGRP